MVSENSDEELAKTRAKLKKAQAEIKRIEAKQERLNKLIEEHEAYISRISNRETEERELLKEIENLNEAMVRAILEFQDVAYDHSDYVKDRVTSCADQMRRLTDVLEGFGRPKLTIINQ